RRRTEGVPEIHALIGDAIDVRRLEVGVPGVTDRIPSQIIKKDEQNVRLACRRFWCLAAPDERRRNGQGGDKTAPPAQGTGLHPEIITADGVNLSLFIRTPRDIRGANFRPDITRVGEFEAGLLRCEAGSQGSAPTS